MLDVVHGTSNSSIYKIDVLLSLSRYRAEENVDNI